MTSRKRVLPQPALIALDIVAAVRVRHLPMNEFELRMHQRGCDSRSVHTAVAALERRGWALRQTGALEITEAGYDAALKGPSVVRRKLVAGRTRMARGMFG